MTTADLEGRDSELRRIKSIIRSKPIPYGTVTLPEIHALVYPHLHRSVHLREYIQDRHADKIQFVQFIDDAAQTRLCLREDAHRYHIAYHASSCIEKYSEMVILAVAILAATESVPGRASISISEFAVTWDYWFDRYMGDLGENERDLGFRCLGMTKNAQKRGGQWSPQRGDILRAVRKRLRASETARTLVALDESTDRGTDTVIRLIAE